MDKGEVKIKIIDDGKTHTDKKCECPFCLCKCPVCGTAEISVTFRPEWEFINDTENRITIDRMGDYIVVDCPECGEFQHRDGISQNSNADLRNISQFLEKALNLPYSVDLEYEDGKTNISRGYPIDED